MNRIVRFLKRGGKVLALASIMGLLLAGCGGGSGQPDAPSIGTATAGNAEATVNFTPPLDNGGADITNYTVTSIPGNLTASGVVSPIIITGLTNGTAYRFTVTATNIGGTSVPSSPSNSVTPSASAPGAPTIGIATAGNAQANVSFTPPVNDGGVAINYYTVTSTPGNVTAFGATSPITITGLTNGTSYSFTVTATNSAGTSPASASSNSVSLTGTIPFMPFNGTAAAASSGQYSYMTLAEINTIDIGGAGAVFVQVFIDDKYAELDTNWLCTTAQCTATAPIPAATTLYLGVNNIGTVAAAFNLAVSNANQSEGAKDAPKAITLPYGGKVGSTGDSYYSYTSGASTASITVTNMTDDVDLLVYTDATFGAFDANWSCATAYASTAPETCTATTPVSPGTPIYIGIYNGTVAGGTFTLQTP